MQSSNGIVERKTNFTSARSNFESISAVESSFFLSSLIEAAKYKNISNQRLESLITSKPCNMSHKDIVMYSTSTIRLPRYVLLHFPLITSQKRHRDAENRVNNAWNKHIAVAQKKRVKNEENDKQEGNSRVHTALKKNHWENTNRQVVVTNWGEKKVVCRITTEF